MPTLERDLANAAVGIFAGGSVTDDFLEALIDELVESDLYCDHSVGICACGELEVLRELRLLVNGRETCGVCSGEGHTYKEGHVTSCQGLWDEGYDCENAHFSTCFLCGGKGWVLRDEFYDKWRWRR